MFCPKCATQNADDAKYCRSCGADVSLVPEALTGRLAERLAEGEGKDKGRRHKKETPTVESAVRQFFMGLAFIFIALAILIWAPGGSSWWFWMLMPAFVFLGGGVGIYLRVREEQKRLAPPAFVPAQYGAMPAATPRATELPPRRNTGELAQPPSVTEATTRHLAMPSERPPKDV